MTHETNRVLIRLLVDPDGDREWTPEEARTARARVTADPELRQRLDRLRATWDDLELAPPAAPPPGFATRVAALAREERRGGQTPWRDWIAAPTWARATAVLALVVGMASGPLLVTSLADRALESPATVELVAADGGLADLYLVALQEEAETTEGEGAQ